MSKPFKTSISLCRNSRGCYILDTVKGCPAVLSKLGGCYGDCYAHRIAERYLLDFKSATSRRLDVNTQQPMLWGVNNADHLSQIRRQIKSAKMPFVRIGEMGDPSWDWSHTLDICDQIKDCGKTVVVITKHWRPVADQDLPRLKGVCVNTSVSALDSDEERAHRLKQFDRIAGFCKSVLRIVTCDFNTETEFGTTRSKIQESLIAGKRFIETVFRPSKQNPLVVSGYINTEERMFLGKNMLSSMRDASIYFGDCQQCPDMCGLNT